MMIFVLTAGERNYHKTMMATTEVKEVAKAYVDIINDGKYGDLFMHPYIEMRRAGELESLPHVFSENVNKEKRLVKHLSKLAWEIQNNPDA